MIKKKFTSEELHAALDIEQKDENFVGACWRMGGLTSKGYKQGNFSLDVEHARCDYSMLSKKLKIWGQFSCKDGDAACDEGLVGGGRHRRPASFRGFFF